MTDLFNPHDAPLTYDMRGVPFQMEAARNAAMPDSEHQSLRMPALQSTWDWTLSRRNRTGPFPAETPKPPTPLQPSLLVRIGRWVKERAA